MSCYSATASNMSCYSANDSDCAEQPRDFSLIDSSPDSLCSPPPPPLPLPRISKVRPLQASAQHVDGSFVRREPAAQGPSNLAQFHREVLNKLAIHLARERDVVLDEMNRDPSTRRRLMNNYSDAAILNQGGREALNSHYEQWTGDVSRKRLPATLPAAPRRAVPVSSSLARPTSARHHEEKIRTVVKYVEYNSCGNRTESKYIIKMPVGSNTLKDFKKVIPHYVRRPRFFFSIGANENIEIDDDNAKLPTISTEEGEPIIVAEITSRSI